MRPFLASRLAWREGRAAARRLGVFMGAVALGVGALTGLHSFQADAADAAGGEARELLGGDLRVQASSPFPEEVEAVLDSMAGTGVQVSRVTTLASVVRAFPSERNRLLQLNAVDGAYPLVGRVTDEPAGSWARIREGGWAAADRQVLDQLGIGVGDTLQVGELRLAVSGSVRGLPVDLGVQTIVGPPLFLSLEDLSESGLLTFGSLGQFRAFLVLPPGQDPDAVARHLRDRIQEPGVRVRTARAEAESFAEGFRSLAGFLGLVGLMALLLGGIGVASAVHVYVRDRIPSVAVLRCLGAPEATVFRVYLLQAAGLGLAGSLLGVALGVGLQFGIPSLLRDLLPFTLEPRLRPWTLLAGLGVGIWTALLFALLPLLRVREIPPLAALRTEVEEGAARHLLPRVVVLITLAATLLELAGAQTGGLLSGAVFAGALLTVLGALALLAAGLARSARHFLPTGAPFPLRQGIAGLFRPGNQTTAVLTALGFGAFLVGSLAVVEAGLRAGLQFHGDGGEPSLLLFDIQEDQRPGVEEILAREGAATSLIPIAPARLSSLRGVPVRELADRGELSGWMTRRIFRNTWREELTETEQLLEGRWWTSETAGTSEANPEESGELARGAALEPEGVRGHLEAGSVRVSLEEEIAEELGLGVGDEIVWDVQGRPVSSVVTSIRRVDWASLRPNFYAVFEPGALDGAPASWIGLVPEMDPTAGARLQNALLDHAPNVSFLDISQIRETVQRISGQVTRALRTLAAVAIAGGFLVLLAALLGGRFRRRRESALLKTLGAGARTIRGTLLTEYLVLGGVGATAGLLLGAGGGILLLHFGFQAAFPVPWGTLGALWVGVVALTVAAGWSVSGPVLREPPLVILREVEG